MIGDVIDTFRITIPAVNRKFVRKSGIETSTCHSTSYSNNKSVNQTSAAFAILQHNVLHLNSNQRANEQNNTNRVSYSIQSRDRYVKHDFSGGYSSFFQIICARNFALFSFQRENEQLAAQRRRFRIPSSLKWQSVIYWNYYTNFCHHRIWRKDSILHKLCSQSFQNPPVDFATTWTQLIIIFRRNVFRRKKNIQFSSRNFSLFLILPRTRRSVCRVVGVL